MSKRKIPAKSRTKPGKRAGGDGALPKAPTGITGLDEITGGGVPRGRPTLVCGGAGCGKTLLAMEFLMRGALEHNEPGVFMAFEETAEELALNVRSLGFDLDELTRRKKIVVDFVRIEKAEIDEVGDYDLEGLFVRLNHAIDSIGAKRVVLDTLEALFSGLSNAAVLRSELRRLFRWLKEKGVTAMISGERGEGQLTRHGLEEYVSDCVILLDHRVIEQISTRRLRVVKYRGTTHGTNEYPFMIDESGIHVLPITSLGLDHAASRERISSGIPGLDEMLGGPGYFRGSSVLVTGTAGVGKSSVAAHFARAACARGERCLFFAFEESASQIIRNMRSIGLHLEPLVRQGLLRFQATRSTVHGLESRLVAFHKLVRDFKPRVVIFDAVDNLTHAGSPKDAAATVTRLIDHMKVEGITALLTNLGPTDNAGQRCEVEISSLADTWILLRNLEHAGERNRALYILKSRGMAHSNQVREFLLTNRGIQLQEVSIGPDGVLVGSARQAQEAREKAAALARRQEWEERSNELDRKREAVEARIILLRKEFEAEKAALKRGFAQRQVREQGGPSSRARLASVRNGGLAPERRSLSRPK